MATATGIPSIPPEPLASPAVGGAVPLAPVMAAAAAPAAAGFPGAPVARVPAPAVPVALDHDDDAGHVDDAEWRFEGRWRWLTTALLVLGLAGLVVNQETFAATTFVVRNPNNAFATGYVELEVGRPNSWVVAAADLMPGDGASGAVTLSNTGNEDIGMIRLTTESATVPAPVLISDPTFGLQIGLDRCTEPWTETQPLTCPGTQSYNFFTCKAENRGILVGYPGGALKAGAKDYLRVRIVLPEAAGREFMGLSASLKFTFVASQEPAPLTPQTCSLLTPTPAPTATLVPGAVVFTPTHTLTPTITRTVTPTTTPVGAHGEVNTPVPPTRTYGAGTPSPAVPTASPLATRPTSTPVGAHGDVATPGPPPPTPSPFLGSRASPTPAVLHMKSLAPDESADGVLP